MANKKQGGSKAIVMQSFNQGGVADSKYSGLANSMARMVGWNLHQIPGLLQVNQKMTKTSGIIVTEYCKARVDASNGIKYWFSSTSGKIWQDKAGVFTLVYTVIPTGGSAAILDAIEYQGYMYFFTQNYIHRIQTTLADGASAWTTNAVPNWNVFTNGDATYHPALEVNLVLYIGDKNYVAQVDSGVFSANALDVESQYRVSALGKYGTDLLVGTIIASTVSKCEIFRWNTWSISFTGEDTVYEPGINSFLEADNYVVVNAGLSGNLYSYNGSQLQTYKKIPGVYSPTAQAKINPCAVALMNGYLPIFGVSNVTGNPCDQGIWSIGRYGLGYTIVFNLEWPTSFVDADGYNILSGVEIGALMVVGTDLYQSWQKSTTVTITIASPGVVTYTAHGLTDGDAIVFTTTGALPTGLTAGTTYFVKSTGANTLNLYDTSAHAVSGGATGRVDTSGSQSGVHTATNVGIDKLDYSNKIVHPFLETRVISPTAGEDTIYNTIIATYESLPASTSVDFKYGVNGESPSAHDLSPIDDAIHAMVKVDQARIEGRTVQIRMEAVASGNTAPSIQELIIPLE